MIPQQKHEHQSVESKGKRYDQNVEYRRIHRDFFRFTKGVWKWKMTTNEARDIKGLYKVKGNALLNELQISWFCVLNIKEYTGISLHLQKVWEFGLMKD